MQLFAESLQTFLALALSNSCSLFILPKNDRRPLFFLILSRGIKREDWPEMDKLTMKKQPSRDVLNKRCSENMQQIYRRTAMMPKCDFNKVALHGCSPVNLQHISRIPFPKNITGWLLLTM